MKHLKTFSIFESTGELTQKQIDFLDNFTKGTWTLNSEGLVDIQGNFDCSGEDLTDFRGIKFGRVSGNFYFYKNEFKSLEGVPKEVGGSFRCDQNNLVSLVGSPQKVKLNFSCQANNLVSLVGAPKEIGEDFICGQQDFVTLEGSPEKVGGFFSCIQNPLQSLKGAPKEIGGYFNIRYVDVPAGKWSLQTLAEMYRNSDGEKKKLLGTLVSPEALQKEIDANPERAAVDYKSIVHLPEFKGLKWPESLKTEVDLLSDLDSVGL